jgi:hypothetical protein
MSVGSKTRFPVPAGFPGNWRSAPMLAGAQTAMVFRRTLLNSIGRHAG